MAELFKDSFGEVVTSRVPNPKIYCEISGKKTYSVLTDEKKKEVSNILDDFIKDDVLRETQK